MSIAAHTPWRHTNTITNHPKVKWSNDPRPTPSRKIPTYTWNHKYPNVGCKDHGDPACLCDVNVSTETPIGPYPLVFSGIANAIHGTPTKRNFVQWASTLLGCFETERRLVEREDAEGVYSRLPYHEGPPQGWHKLGPELREDFLWYAYNTHTRFNDLLWLVPKDFTEAEVAHVRKLYNKARSDHRLHKYQPNNSLGGKLK